MDENPYQSSEAVDLVHGRPCGLPKNLTATLLAGCFLLGTVIEARVGSLWVNVFGLAFSSVLAFTAIRSGHSKD